MSLTLAALPVACGGDTAAHATSGADEATELRLDDGQKWQVDEHTRASMLAIREILTTAAPASLEGYREVGTRLDRAIDALIGGCTLRGPAHDQLHVFLNRFLPPASVLAKPADEPAARAAFAELEGLLALWAAHFE